MEEQKRLEKEQRKGGSVLGGGGIPYPPININCRPSRPTGLDVTAPTAAAGSAATRDMGPLQIPVFRDVAFKEDSEWLASRVSGDTLKAAFRKACEVMLSGGFDLEHIYKDQTPEFFVGKGIKPGIARTFVENIRDWVENVKKAVAVLEAI